MTETVTQTAGPMLDFDLLKQLAASIDADVDLPWRRADMIRQLKADHGLKLTKARGVFVTEMADVRASSVLADWSAVRS